MSPELRTKFRKLCLDIAHAHKWFVVEADYSDDAWLRQMLDQYISVDFLKLRYSKGYFELEEFEHLLDLKLGCEPVPSECP